MDDIWLNELKAYCLANQACKAKSCTSVPPEYCLILIKEIEQLTNISLAYSKEVVELRHKIKDLTTPPAIEN